MKKETKGTKFQFENYLQKMYKERLLAEMNSECSKNKRERAFQDTRLQNPLELLKAGIADLSCLSFHVSRLHPYFDHGMGVYVLFGVEKIVLFSLCKKKVISQLPYPQGVSLLEYSRMILSPSKRYLYGERIVADDGKYPKFDKISLKTSELWSFHSSGDQQYSLSNGLLHKTYKYRASSENDILSNAKIIQVNRSRSTLSPSSRGEWAKGCQNGFDNYLMIPQIFPVNGESTSYLQSKSKEVRIKLVKSVLVVFQNVADKKNLRTAFDVYSYKTKKRIIKHRSVQVLRPNIKEIDIEEFDVTYRYFSTKKIFIIF